MKPFLRLIALGVGLMGAAAAGEPLDGWKPLWPGKAPGGSGQPRPEVVNQRGSYFETTPAYQVMLPPADIRTGAAVVVMPGGGYGMLAMNHEGIQYAEWLNQRGIVAVVLKYRVSRHADARMQYPVPLWDVRQAIRLTRAHAVEWQVDPGKVGVMGSSAGGHLASMAATMSAEEFSIESRSETGSRLYRPDFAILVYPVIAMNEPWGHQGSRQKLLGDSPSKAWVDSVSTHLRVDAQTPPCFLVHAADDRVVPVRNSTAFAERCAEAGVPVVCQIVAEGGHGFGLGGKGDSGNWTRLLDEWLQLRQLGRSPQ